MYCKCFGYWQSQTGQDCALHTNITNITTNQLDLLLPGPAINYSIYGIHIMDTCGFMYNVYTYELPFAAESQCCINFTQISILYLSRKNPSSETFSSKHAGSDLVSFTSQVRRRPV